jgi:hypothetical protein
LPGVKGDETMSSKASGAGVCPLCGEEYPAGLHKHLPSCKRRREFPR